MNQSFNSQQLFKLCKQAEFAEYGLTSTQLIEKLGETYEEIIKSDFEFEIIETNNFYLIKNLPHKLVLRKLNDNIKRLYKDEQANRRIIISQIKTLLDETCPFWIIKTDIKSFYESINHDRIIEKFRDDAMLSYQSMYLLEVAFNNSLLSGMTGLPRGMNISSTLSEIYMRKFDRWIRRCEGVYYYARFVDDIIIFTNTLQSALDLITNFNIKLLELAEGLEINQTKTELFIGGSLRSIDKATGVTSRIWNSLEYLGYKFEKERVGKITNLKVTIADKKIRKIKTRIIFAFLDFLKSKDFRLLENRIKFLTGNYSIRTNIDGNDLRAGIYYNYMQVTDLSIFDELNIFYRKALFSKNQQFGKKLYLALTPTQKSRLNNYCFKTGFDKKVYNSFTFDEMSSIISCW